MNNKIFLGLVFALPFLMIIGPSHLAFSQTIQCSVHSTHQVHNNIPICACDLGYVPAQNSNPVIPLCIPQLGNPVGGMGIPIDTTALLLAGVQGSSLWMIPGIVIAGAGIGIVSFKRSRKKLD